MEQQQSALRDLIGGEDALKRRETEQQAEKEKARRLERARDDFGYFCRTYLPHYFTSSPAEYQDILTRVENEEGLSEANLRRLKGFIKPKYHGYMRPVKKLSGIVDVEPREHGKTVRNSFAKPLWRLLTGKNRFVLIIGATQGAAEDNIINIRSELEDNELLIADYGDQKTPKGKWADSRLELANGTCIQGKGAGSAMRGVRYRQYRPDLVILDDLMKDDAAESAAWRDKIFRWAKRVVFLLGKEAFVVFVNTIFHGDDIVNRLLAEIEDGTLDDWAGFRFSCWRPDGVTPLWPEHWSASDLLNKKKNLGTAVFSTEMENEPLSDEDRMIRIEWIRSHWYRPEELPRLDDMRRFAGIDPSAGSHDQMAIVSIGVDRSGIIWELDSWGKPCSETELVETLILKHRIFRYTLIAWENVAFQTVYQRYVMRLSAEKGVYLPIKGISPKGVNKETRIRKLSPLIENGLIRLRADGSEELIDQLWNFPKHTFDDQPDALAYAVTLAEGAEAGPMAFPGRTMSKVRSLLGGRRPGSGFMR